MGELVELLREWETALFWLYIATLIGWATRG